MQKKGVLIGLWMLCITVALVCTACAAEVGLEDYAYNVDFESGSDPIVYWTSDGLPKDKSFTINYKGITTEKAHSGKSCYKIDVTFNDCSYVYWNIPLDLSAEGQLKASVYYQLGSENTANVAIGARLDLLPPYSGYILGYRKNASSSTKGEWALAERTDFLDSFKDKDYLSQYLARYFWGINGENVTPCVKGLNILAFGKKGTRAVIYIDDVDISGKVMGKAEFASEIKRRWAPVPARYTEKFNAWEKALSEQEKNLILSGKDDNVNAKVTAILKEELDALQQKIKAARKKAWMNPVDVADIDKAIESLKKKVLLKNNIQKTIRSYSNNHYAVYRLSSPLGSNVMPDDVLVGGSPASDGINVLLSSGEYEPAGLVIASLDNEIKDLTIRATDLIDKSGVIPAGNIDIKVVKRWYQAVGTNYGTKRVGNSRVLVSELLLNDDGLVKVDNKTRKNYIRLSFPEDPRYVDISDPNEKSDVPVVGVHSAMHTPKDFPVKDSSMLLPVNIPAGANQQFLVTVHAPAGTKPGIYKGEIQLRSSDGLKEDLALNVEVLPINLMEPYYTSSIYYGSSLNKAYPDGSLTWLYKSEEQLRNELSDLIRHGVTNPICYQGAGDLELFKKYMAIRKEFGITNKPLYSLIGTGNPTKPEDLAELKKKVRKVIDIAKEYGATEVYFYGVDEATGERLRSQRKAWQAVHEAGGKVFVAGSGDIFDSMGDLLDTCVYPHIPVLSEAEKWHSSGRKIWSYSNPQGGVENSDVYRRNYGLLLWQKGYDGACTFAYMANYGNSWNDFDGIMYKDESMVYPTVNGVIDTIQWEVYREGIDDVRYITTLQHDLDEANAAKDGKRKEAITAADKFIRELKSRNLQSEDPDALRKEIISHILALKGQKL